MSDEKDYDGDSCRRDTQIDLFTLIGGSWPPAPCEPSHPENYSALHQRPTMQKPLQNDRIKSVNLIEHLVPERRRNRQASTISSSEESPQKQKMVHDVKKIETGILVESISIVGLGESYVWLGNERNPGSEDVCSDSSQNIQNLSISDSPHPLRNTKSTAVGRTQEISGRGSRSGLDDTRCGDNCEEFYDSPALGSPRAATLHSRSSSVGHIQDEIGVGSLVEVATDVDQHHYGVVRWIGIIDDTPTAGVELEQSVCGLGDGSRNGSRLFSCGVGRALFVPLPLCRRDARFRDTPPPPGAAITPPHNDRFEQPDCPVVPGVVPPLSCLGDLAGKNRGIQGHHNSCYLDATLFAMFTFTSVFDALLYRPPEPEDSPHYGEVQRVLREEVVNPLRRHGYVRADRVMQLRTLLERLSDVPGLTSEEKDPEEFLNGLVAQLLRAEPFLKLSSGQESFCYQLFVEKDEHVSLPTVQQLLEQSFATSGVKLSEVPSTFIIQMPRFGKQYKLYQQVLPSPLLDVTDLIEGLPRECAVCGSLARWECSACAGGAGAAQGGGALEGGALCSACLHVVHNARPQHKATPLSVCEEYASVMESCTLPRVYMELFAVLCIETSHYVAFVKAGAGIDAPWCFFDSMADRKGERNGYNIPEIVSVGALGTWLGEEARLPPHAPHARRLLADAYMCFYRSPDVAMYR